MKNLICICSVAFIVCSLNGYSQHQDSITKNDTTIFAWKVDQNSFEHIQTKIDTNINTFHRYNILHQNGFSYAHLGFIGSPAKKINYFSDSFQTPTFLFLCPFAPYLSLTQNTTYYNTKKPFTNLFYTANFGNKKEINQMINVLHTQNVNEKLNIGLKYNHISSRGFYNFDDEIHKTGIFSLFTSYQSTKYEAYGNLNINKIRPIKNGGIEVDFFQNNDENPKTYSTLLSNVESIIRNRSIGLTQKFHIGKTVVIDKTIDTTNKETNDTISIEQQTDTIVHDSFHKKATFIYRFSLNDNFRKYIDNNVENNLTFYDHVLDSTSTLDSAYLKSFNNSLHIKFYEKNSTPLSFGGLFGLSYNLGKYGFNRLPSDSTDTDTLINEHFYDVVYHAHLTKTLFPRLKWTLDARHGALGYHKQDTWIHSDLTFFMNEEFTSYIQLLAKHQEVKPDFFHRRYFSNHITWETWFDREKKQTIKLSLNNQPHHIKIGLNYEQNEQFIYFDTNSIPRQSAKGTKIFSINANKSFHLWKFIIQNQAIYHHVTNQNILHLPRWILYNSTRFNQNIFFKETGGNIQFQIGFDLYYFTSYHGYSYNPVINQFYLQKENKMGDYLFADAYLGMKIKRLRFFLKMNHINEGWFEKNYITVWHYPMNPRNLRFGLSWNFYD